MKRLQNNVFVIKFFAKYLKQLISAKRLNISYFSLYLKKDLMQLFII